MRFFDFKSLLYSDTLVPDIFISEYLPALKSEHVKIYVYCLFLAGKDRTPSVPELSRILGLPAEVVKGGLHFMGSLGLLVWTDEGVVLADLKEKEIKKLYRPISALAPEDAERGLMANERRRQVITAINETFFSGVMSPGWYGEITRWFEIYGFEEDVMLMLFRHCCDHGGLATAYVAKVAENWHRKGIRNSFDVERYLREYEAMKTVSHYVHKKLRLRTPFTEYQEDIIDKWVNVYRFPVEVIDRALMQSKWKLETGLGYYDKILAAWHEAGFDTAEKVDAHIKERRRPTRAASAASAASAGGRARYRQSGFPQRAHDDAIYARLVSSKFGGPTGSPGGARGGAPDGSPADATGGADGAAGDTGGAPGGAPGGEQGRCV